MTIKNKEIIRKVNDAFAADDTETILSYVADDVRWTIAGISTAVGKEEFRKEIHNDAFEGAPTITIKNEIEEGNYVAVEGAVKCKMKDGSIFETLFHNTYFLEAGKIKEMTSYLVPKK